MGNVCGRRPRKVVLIDMNFTRKACLDKQLSDRYKRALAMFDFYIVKRVCIVLDTSEPKMYLGLFSHKK